MYTLNCRITAKLSSYAGVQSSSLRAMFRATDGKGSYAVLVVYREIVESAKLSFEMRDISLETNLKCAVVHRRIVRPRTEKML